MSIPFLKPNLVKNNTYKEYLDLIDDSRIYSNYGPINSEFEKKMIAQLFNGEGNVSTVNNATIGLILSIMLKKREGSRYAVMPSFTFSATAQAAMWCGLEPYFIDVRHRDWCMDESLLKECVEELGDEVAVVVPYATFGSVLDLSYYQRLIDSGVPVVVDAAASLGATYNGEGLQATFDGPIVYSLHATKSFGVGEGGLVYSKDERFIEQLRAAGNFGFNSSRESTQLGLNSKMPEFTAAIGLATLEVFNDKLNTRVKLRECYKDRLQEVGLLERGWQIHESDGEIPHQHMPLLCPKGVYGRDIVTLLGDLGIEARTYFSPACHEQQLFSKYNCTIMSVTEDISNRIINLPLWEELGENDIELIVSELLKLSVKIEKDLVYAK